jgi:two-component system chemotaxis response regulator CheY
MASLSDLHLLIVDDNQQMRVTLRSLLRAGGVLHISEAANAAGAFDIMRKHPADLLITDWNMQPIDGIAFTRMVRLDRDSPNPLTPILMVTAHTEISRVAAARDAGVTGFIKKPVTARLLFDRVSSALTDARMFVRTGDFFGPDRRFGHAAGYAGPWRRESDQAAPALDAPHLDTLDLDDVRWRA